MKLRTGLNLQKAMALLILVSLSFAATAQKKVDFSGTWNLDKSLSNQHPEFSWAPVQLNISQERKLIAIERVSNWQGEEFRQTSKYSLDGKESVNEGFQGQDFTSIASWAKDKKSITIVTDLEMQDGGILNLSSTYGMEDGNLKIEFNTKGGPMGDSAETWIYNKE